MQPDAAPETPLSVSKITSGSRHILHILNRSPKLFRDHVPNSRCTHVANLQILPIGRITHNLLACLLPASSPTEEAGPTHGARVTFLKPGSQTVEAEAVAAAFDLHHVVVAGRGDAGLDGFGAEEQDFGCFVHV